METFVLPRTGVHNSFVCNENKDSIQESNSLCEQVIEETHWQGIHEHTITLKLYSYEFRTR